MFLPSLRRNPLDHLPRSNFNIEARTRSVRIDTRGAGGSLEWFYEKYALVTDDLGGFSDNFAFSV